MHKGYNLRYYWKEKAWAAVLSGPTARGPGHPNRRHDPRPESCVIAYLGHGPALPM